MKILCVFLLGSALAAGQDSLFDKAPPEVDQALRERINKFYQAHVDGKFRLADQFVAEDSKDVFFEADKHRYKSCSLTKVQYSENFTKAQAVVACQGEFRFRGQVVPVTMPLTSLWKTVRGEWFWYTPPVSKQMNTPFGEMKAGPEDKDHSASPFRIPDVNAAAEEILKKVTVDKNAVQLSSYEPASDTVMITNGLNGPVRLSVQVDNAFPGFTAKLAKSELNGGEKTQLILEAKPQDKVAKPTATARIRVEPIGVQIPIQITFAIPPEIQKLIPK